jgi:hypothetical protein
MADQDSRSRGVAGLLPALVTSAVLTASGAAVAGLGWYGLAPAFGALWLENWLVSWAIVFPMVYLFGSRLSSLFVYLSSPITPDQTHSGRAVWDIAAMAARETERHGFTVLCNLKVREDLYCP